MNNCKTENNEEDLQPVVKKPILPILLTFLGAAGYTVSPVDAIPDVIPLLGQLDDVGIIALAICFCVYRWTKYKRAKG